MTNNGTNIYVAMQLAKYRQEDLVREARNARLSRLTRRRGRRTAPDDPDY